MNMDKIKQFAADHKKELIAAAVVVGGAVLVILGYKHRARKLVANTSSLFGGKDIPVPDGLKVWDTMELWRDDNNNLIGIIGSIPLDDLGELGKEFIKNGLAQSGDLASVIIGVDHDK